MLPMSSDVLFIARHILLIDVPFIAVLTFPNSGVTFDIKYFHPQVVS